MPELRSDLRLLLGGATKLTIHSWNAATPQEALDAAAGLFVQPAVALTYSARAFVIASLRGQVCSTHEGYVVTLDQSVFRLVAFNERAALHWQRRETGGVAAILTEESLSLPGAVPAEHKCPQFIDGVRHLLWGTVRRVTDHWSELSERRIKPYWFPRGAEQGVTEGARLVLTQREYVEQGETHGNARVRWSRYLGAEASDAKKS